MAADIVSMLKRSTIVHLMFAISFFTSGLIINIAQFLMFVFIKPFNKRLYRSVMYYLCYSFYCQLVFIPDWWSNSVTNIYITDEDLAHCGHEHVLLLMNHYYEIDWLIGWVFCEKQKVLGNCKAYAKKAIQYMPTVGWSWKFAEFVFLERSFEKDKEIIGKQIKNILDYPDPVWLLLNAEGTRFTRKKHAASIEFAKERGMNELKYHLIPRSKGFTTSLPHLKKNGKCKAIMDVQLAFNENDAIKPTIANILNGHSVTSHLYLRRIPMEEVPDNEEKAAQWLQDLFKRKDQMQESFHKHGDFFTSSGVAPIKSYVTKKRVYPMLNTFGWAIVILTPMLYYLAKLLFSGELLYFSIGAGILIAFYILMQKTIAVTNISKGSEYGAADKQKTN